MFQWGLMFFLSVQIIGFFIAIPSLANLMVTWSLTITGFMMHFVSFVGKLELVVKGKMEVV